jgi:hypothetical protein
MQWLMSAGNPGFSSCSAEKKIAAKVSIRKDPTQVNLAGGEWKHARFQQVIASHVCLTANFIPKTSPVVSTIDEPSGKSKSQKTLPTCAIQMYPDCITKMILKC